MKTQSFRITTLPLLGIISISFLMSLSSSAMADTWKTLPGSSCKPHDPGVLKSGQLRTSNGSIKHNDVVGGPTYTSVVCPIKMDDNAPATIAIWTNYTEMDSLSCTIYSDHWDGSEFRSKPVTTNPGGKTYYQTINTGSWWSVQAECTLGNGDKITSFNYKAL